MDRDELGRKIEEKRQQRFASQTQPVETTADGEVGPERRLLRLFLLAGAVLVGLLVWPGPQLLEAKRIADKRERQHARVDREREEYMRRARQQSEIRNASDGELRQFVNECENRIRDKFSGSPYELYFPSYSPAQLRRYGDVAIASGMELGRPSTVMHGADQTERNMEALKTGQTSNVDFVVEGASESWSGPYRWARVYTCYTGGLSILAVERADEYALD